MNVSYKWLGDYIEHDLTAQQVADAVTSTGLEADGVERVESIRGGLRGLVIGRVLTCEPHPDSDHMHVTTVDVGQEQPLQIVCGAPNVAAGQAVVVATVGTVLYDGDKEIKIKRGKLRGVESLGMICAEDEIGVGTSHAGIIIIPDDKAPAPGTPAAQYYGLEDDYRIEVDLTPNRIDGASHYGVARDLAAWFTAKGEPKKAHRPSVDDFAVNTPEGGVTVEVANPEVCPRYSGITVKGVTVKESPKWLRDRLTAAGLRPINNVVDVSNYILMGLGQPLHTFDADKIEGSHIVVRKARPGEKFTTLDGEERTLDGADLMICSAERPMCIAGVFGGLDSGVTDRTKDVFIESACFNPTSVRRTARRHGLSTDASFRYERGTDPNDTVYCLKLAAKMIQQLAGGKIVGPMVDIYPEPVKPPVVELSYDQIDALIGQPLEHYKVDAILASLDIAVKERCPDGTMVLEVPTYRVDVTRPADVIEEILRIYGYDNIATPTQVRATLAVHTPTDRADDMRRRTAEQLTAQGFNEILNNSLTAERYYQQLATYPADRCVRLLNPLSADLSVMRQTLLFGGLETIARNINHRATDLALYETGNVYALTGQAAGEGADSLAPYKEGSRMALWLTGQRRAASWDRPAEEYTVYDLKAAVLALLTRLGIPETDLTLTQRPNGDDIFDAAIDISMRKGGKHLGTLGQVSRSLLHAFDIKQPVYFAELDWTAVTRAAMRLTVTFEPLPKTQPVHRDLALLVDRAVTFDQIRQAIADTDRRLIAPDSIRLFDVYEGDKLPQDKKSYAVTFTLQDPQATLQDKRIEAVMAKVVANLQKAVGAELR